MGVTPCQFDSDLRHHFFKHEKAPNKKWGLLLLYDLPTFCRHRIFNALPGVHLASLFIFGIPSREISPKAELQGEYGQPYDDEDYYQDMFESHNVWRYFTHLVNRVDYRHGRRKLLRIATGLTHG